MGRPLDEDIIIKILERWQKAFKENSHYVSASDLSLVIKDVRELPTIQSVATDTNVGDTISRQAVLDAIVQCTNCGDEDTLREYVLKHSLDNGWTGGILEALDAVKDLPPAQPERKRGEWVYNSPVTMKCNRCGLVIKDWDWHRFKICPNCGADMRGKKDG